jgi:hypothetical protein
MLPSEVKRNTALKVRLVKALRLKSNTHAFCLHVQNVATGEYISELVERFTLSEHHCLALTCSEFKQACGYATDYYTKTVFNACLFTRNKRTPIILIDVPVGV